MAVEGEPQSGRGHRSGRGEPGVGGLPVPVDLSGYAVPDRGVGVLAGVPAGSGQDVPPGAGTEALTIVREAVGSVRVVGDACGRLVEGDLDEAARVLLGVREGSERSLVLVLADAMARGVVAGSDSGGPVQWLTDRATHLEPGAAGRMVQAARAVNRAENGPVRAALVAGDVGVDAVVTALREVPKVMAVLPDASRDEVLGVLSGGGPGGVHGQGPAPVERAGGREVRWGSGGGG